MKTEVPDIRQPPQTQVRQPGLVSSMQLRPESEGAHYRPAGKLQGLVASITGGDNGIGRAVAIAFAREGAKVAIVCLNEHEDAQETKDFVESVGSQCITRAGDVANPIFCADAVASSQKEFGKLDNLVNNAVEQHPQESLKDIAPEQLERTFRTNIFAYLFMTREALNHPHRSSAITNTSSVAAYRGSSQLVDYSSTKAAIVGFTRSLALKLAKQGIRVNAVASGPIWTPLIPATFDEQKLATFGSDVPLQRAGQPEEVAPAYVLLASADSSYMFGQVLHPNGGEIKNA